MGEMPEYKSQHYVPQMYMRLFAGADEKRVGVYVINGRRFIPNAPIRGQACRDYFYGKDPRAEKTFGRIENQASRIIAQAIEHGKVPEAESEDHEWLIFYLGIQHSRTVGAAEQHNEGSEKLAKAVLRRKAELEGNTDILAALDKVRIRRTNAVSEVVGYATIGASLLADLTFVLIEMPARPLSSHPTRPSSFTTDSMKTSISASLAMRMWACSCSYRSDHGSRFLASIATPTPCRPVPMGSSASMTQPTSV